MSDVRLSNASPTVERVDARQQDRVRLVRRSLFGRPNPEETRRQLEAVIQDGVQDFRERYNFDPVEERPLSPGNYEWHLDGDAPEYYSRPPHGSQPRPEDGDGGAASTGPGHAAGTRRPRKRRSGPCSDECPSRRSRSDDDDGDDDEDCAGSQAIPVVDERPNGSESGVGVP